MTNSTMIEATAELSELIDRATGGEVIVLTRDGRPAARLDPIAAASGRPVTAEQIEWLDSIRVGDPAKPTNATAALSAMRDGD